MLFRISALLPSNAFAIAIPLFATCPLIALDLAACRVSESICLSSLPLTVSPLPHLPVIMAVEVPLICTSLAETGDTPQDRHAKKSRETRFPIFSLLYAVTVTIYPLI